MLFQSNTYFCKDSNILNQDLFGGLIPCWIVLENYSVFKYIGQIKDFFDNADEIPENILDWHIVFFAGNPNEPNVTIIEPDLDACIERINNYFYPLVDDSAKVRLN